MTLTPPISTARAYFEYIRDHADPFSFLSEIPSPPRPTPFFEEEWIDFKGQPADDKDAKKIWSKALSGFANITDGLIIWGIDARKTPPRNIDAACGVRLITDPHAFESRLRDWIRDATNPPVMNVEYRSVPSPTGEGFVVCFIPESTHKPHRAEIADKQYYYRAGDDFLPAEPGLLRTLFYPQTRPFVWLNVTLRYELNPRHLEKEYRENPSVRGFNELVNSTSTLQLTGTLQNSGSATARDLYVVLQSDEELNISPGPDWKIGQNPRGRAAFRAHWPIHPGEMTTVFTASFQKAFGNRTPRSDGATWEIIPHFDTVRLRFLLYADGSQQQEAGVEFAPEDLSFDTGSAEKEAVPTI